MDENYPYPTFEKDGFEFVLLEQDEVEDYPHELVDFPSDEDRYNVQAGDIVKVIISYKEDFIVDGVEYSTERLWIEVLENKETHLEGKVDSFPVNKKVLKAEGVVNFHPMQIIGFWNDEE